MSQMSNQSTAAVFNRILQKIDSCPSHTVTFSVCISFAVCFAFLLMTPLDLQDSDLWFHLNQGRQFFRTGAIPSTSFFSYIDPVRHWINYAWLFQVMTYKIFINTGYVGLIVLRSIIYVSIGWLLYLTIAKNRPYSTLAVAFALFCFVGAMSRSIVVRPHIVTYLFLMVTIYVFENKKYFWLLPIVFLLQANIHGIAYPFLLLVWGSYLVEYYVLYKQEKPIGISNRQLLVIFLAPLLLLATPHGYFLLPLPFENAASFVKYYIMEMKPPNLQQFFVFSFWPLSNIMRTIRIGIILVALLASLFFLYKRSLRVSHFLLVCSGIYLLLQSIRFQYLCIFLIVPVLTALCRKIPQKQTSVNLLINSLLIFVVPLSFICRDYYFSDRYPLSFSSVPTVGGKFIQRLPKGQSVLFRSSKAGYLAWVLFPKHKIFMDLELALFDDVNAYEGIHAFTNPTVLQHHIEKYHTAVLYMPFSTSVSPEFTSVLSGYRPIFFDDFGVIFLRDDIPSSFSELMFLNTIVEQHVDKELFSEQEKIQFVEQIEHIAAFDPLQFKAYSLLGNAYFAFGKTTEMISVAETLIKNFPEQIVGYVLKAQALFLLGNVEESVAFFKQAMTKKGDYDRKLFAKNYYVALVALKKYDAAYAILKKFYNPFYKETPPDILYEFAIGAVNAKKYKDAVRYIDIALLAVPESEAAKRKELLRLQGVLKKHFPEGV